MNNVYFGIIIGIFLYFAGSRLLVVAINAWRERRNDAERKAEENTQMIIDRVVTKIQKKK